MTLISPGDYTLQCGVWLWNHDSEITRWQHPAMWQVALGWHAVEFAQTSPILEFSHFQFRQYHCSRHVILHQSPKFYPNRTTLGRKKWHHVDFQDGGSQPGPIMVSLKSPRTTSHRLSIETIALDCSVFEKIAFFGDRQTDKRTDWQHRWIKPLSLSRGLIGTLAVDGWAVVFGTGARRSWAGYGPTQSPPCCTKHNSPPINHQWTNFVLFDMAL